MTERETITCDDLDEAIERYASDGYRLDMIMPADAPRVAILSRGDVAIRIMSEAPTLAGGSAWITGRAGMMYRDLVKDRLGGKVIASHIRIVDGGEVADSVHFHKIDFQIIYCLRGAIRVVYEDQGGPFWLKPGDLVLQPPEIRHRVLEAEAGSEVIEVTSPAEHETWFDRELDLQTHSLNPDRMFRNQRFVRHIGANSVWRPGDQEGMLVSETKIPGVRTICVDVGDLDSVTSLKTDEVEITIVIDGRGVEVKQATM